MCYGCWEEMGKPSDVTPEIDRAAALVRRLYDLPEGAAGGNLHIVTDDWNLEDEHVLWCRDQVVRIASGKVEEFDFTDPQQIAVERELIDLLMPMTEAQRGTVLALEAGYLDEST